MIPAVLVAAILCGNALAQSPLERAVTLARERRYAESRQALEGVPEPSETPQRIAFHRLRAANASGLGDYAAAATEMTLALELSPDDPVLLTGAAMAEFQAGRLDDALRHAGKAGKDATAKAVIGDIQERRGDFGAAAAAYRQAVALAPGQEPYRVALAYELIRHQEFRAAAEFLQQAKTAFPRSATLQTLLGIAQYSDGYTDDAVTSLAAAIATDPKNEAAYRCLAQIVLRSSATPPPEVTAHLCRWNVTVCSAMKLRIARERDDVAMRREAIAGLQRAPPDDPVARCELARAWEWADRLQDARTEMEACVRSDPSPQNHYRMGRIYKRLGLDDLSHAEMDRRQELLRDSSEDAVTALGALKTIR